MSSIINHTDHKEDTSDHYNHYLSEYERLEKLLKNADGEKADELYSALDELTLILIYHKKNTIPFKNKTMKKEILYIEFLNKEKNFKKDKVEFTGPNALEDAKNWGKENLSNYHSDMINRKTIEVENENVIDNKTNPNDLDKYPEEEHPTTLDIIDSDPRVEKAVEKITKAIEFHKNNEYSGKISNLTIDGVNGALNKALDKNFSFKLDKGELNIAHRLIKEQTNKKGLSY